MSRYVRLLNCIKRKRNPSWLTGSQRQALEELKDACRTPGSVNLCGSVGVGKTFLTWTFADEFGYDYFPHVSHFKHAEELSTAGVVVDNNLPDRRAHREVLKVLRFRNVQNAIIVTRGLVEDYTRYVELELDEADIEEVANNLTACGFFSQSLEATSLWYLINSNL